MASQRTPIQRQGPVPGVTVNVKLPVRCESPTGRRR